MELTKKTESGLQKFQTRISEKKEILKNPIVREKLKPNELRVASLCLSEPISTMADKNIIQTPEGQKDVGLVAIIGTIARGLARDIGIKNYSSTDFQYDTVRFLNILKSYYSNFTIDEIRTAFELALVGDLDEYLPKDKHGLPDKNHYQSFSLEFITKILNAYKAYKNKVWNKAILSLPAPEKVVTEAEKEIYRESVKRDILEKFKSFKESEILPEFLAPSLVVKYLNEAGIIPEINPVNEEHGKKAFAICMNSKAVSGYEKNSISLGYEKGEITLYHWAAAERVRDYELIKKAFEENEQLEF